MEIGAGLLPGLTLLDGRRSEGMKHAADSAVTVSQEIQSRFICDNLRRIFLQIYRIVGNVDERDRQPVEFCPECQAKLWWTCNLDAAARSESLSAVASSVAIPACRRRTAQRRTSMDFDAGSQR